MSCCKNFSCRRFFLTLIFSLLFILQGIHGELINSLVAAVGDIAITQIDLAEQTLRLKRLGTRKRRPRRKLEHQALDVLIDKAIIEYTAKQESIIVSDERIANELKREVTNRGMASQKELQNFIKKNSGMSLNEYKENIRHRIMSQQVAQVKTAPDVPSEREIRAWYNKNRRSGYKYRYRIISIPFRVGSLKDEERANRNIIKARKIAVRNFRRAVALYSKHHSKKQGGVIDWQLLDDIAQKQNPYLAQIILRSPVGVVSEAFTLGNAYYLIKVEGKRKASLEELKPRIRNILYAQKQREGFEKWLISERRRLSIKVFLAGYRSL